VIASAETYRALQERTSTLAHRNSEYGEQIEQLCYDRRVEGHVCLARRSSTRI
jgi:hypothetical protein